MSINGSGLNLSNLFSNPQLLGALFPSINVQALSSAFQSEELQAEQPLTQVSQQLSSLTAPLNAWNALQRDLQQLQTDATSLAGISLYQQVSASSSDATAVSASGNSTGNPGTYQVGVSGLMQIEIDNSANQSSNTTALGLSGSFTINGTAVNVAATDTLQTLANNINAANAGVTATVISPSTGVYVLNLGSTQGKALTWTDPNGILQSLGVLNAGLTPKNQVQAAKAAAYTINGVGLTSVTNSDSTTIPGVTLNFLTTTSSNATVTVAQNTASVSAAVQQFANDFNGYLNDMHRYTGKGGALEGNAVLGSILQGMEQAFTAIVPGQPASLNSANSAGVSLSAPVGTPDQFTLTVNSTTLTSAIQSQPTQFASLWNGAGGIATQIENLLNGALGATGGVTTAISAVQTQQQDLNAEMSDPNSSLNQLVNSQIASLQTQFQQTLNAMVAMTQQGAAITQMFYSMTGQSSYQNGGATGL